jgi:methylmalonyl-CoA/ethylmalonyl-CoA epimerase
MHTAVTTGIDHIGIYVTDLAAALRFYRDVLGLPVGAVEERPEHGIRLTRIRAGDVDLELIEGPVERTMLRFLGHRGPGAYHVGLRVDDVDAAMETLRAAGLAFLDETPREGDAMRVAFLQPAAGGGVLVELVRRLV